jgi:hypothetical protein
MTRTLLIVLTVTIASLTLVAQQQHADHQMPAKKEAAKAPEPPEVFCGTMKTGQLCSHGTASALGLTPEKRDAWLASVRKYNKAVNDATLALQAEAKGTLSAAQLAEVERWFAVGVNPQMNQLLAAPSRAASAKGGQR